MLHYLYYFLLLGAPNSPESTHAVVIAIANCEELRVPLAKEKIEGSPRHLGIGLCSNPLEVSLPQEKLHALQLMLHQITGAGYIWDAVALESPVGHLIHATCFRF